MRKKKSGKKRTGRTSTIMGHTARLTEPECSGGSSKRKPKILARKQLSGAAS